MPGVIYHAKDINSCLHLLQFAYGLVGSLKCKTLWKERQSKYVYSKMFHI